MMNKQKNTDCALAHIKALIDERDGDQGRRILKRIDAVKYISLKVNQLPSTKNAVNSTGRNRHHAFDALNCDLAR